MTSTFLLPDLRRDEGCKLVAYPDPLSGGDPWTIGYGCTGPGIGPGTKWTQDQAEAALEQRVRALTDQLTQLLPWFSALVPLRADVLVNMSYNIGLHGLLGFHNTLTFVEHGQYDAAAAGMKASRWASEVGNRALRLARQMSSGVHQSLP